MHNPFDATPLLGFSSNLLYCIGGGTMDRADLSALLDGIQELDWVCFFEYNQEAMSRCAPTA